MKKVYSFVCFCRAIGASRVRWGLRVDQVLRGTLGPREKWDSRYERKNFPSKSNEKSKFFFFVQGPKGNPGFPGIPGRIGNKGSKGDPGRPGVVSRNKGFFTKTPKHALALSA